MAVLWGDALATEPFVGSALGAFLEDSSEPAFVLDLTERALADDGSLLPTTPDFAGLLLGCLALKVDTPSTEQANTQHRAKAWLARNHTEKVDEDKATPEAIAPLEVKNLEYRQRRVETYIVSYRLTVC